MKKVLLSVLVLGLFFVYGLHEKQEESEVKVIPPQPKQNPQVQANVPTAEMKQEQSALPTQQILSPTMSVASGYRDGSYTGIAADAFYGLIQVRATIAGGKITDIVFLQYPNDRDTSREINKEAMVYLKQEAIQAQSADVDIISGATDSWRAFRESLRSALTQATS